MVPTRIALDGPAASGKTTIGVRLARRLGYLYFDTGVMYRAVALAALKAKFPVEHESDVSALAEQLVMDIQTSDQQDGRACTVLLSGEDVTWALRSPAVDASVSTVAGYQRVRIAMTAQQRKVGLRGRVVMVGRDVGTVVLPEAEMKIYLDASLATRAERRYKEQKERGGSQTLESIQESMARRDLLDSSRDLAPLKPATDAHIIDTTGLTIDQAYHAIWQLIGLME